MLKSKVLLCLMSSTVFWVSVAAADISGPIALPPADMFPEGIGLADDGTAYVGSLARNEIWAIDIMTHSAVLFAGEEADLMSVLGVYVNASQELLYVCSSDPAQKHEGRHTELVALSLSDGEVESRYAFPEGGLCNDIAELADGTILATDSVHPRIMALKTDASFEEWIRDPQFKADGFGLNGIAVSGDTVVVGVFSTGNLFEIDTSRSPLAVQPLKLERPLKGPDGIEFLPSGDLIVVEGMDASVAHVSMSGSIETISSGFDVPTTLAVSGGQGIVVQGQLGRFFGMDPSPVEPFELKVIPVPK